MTDKRKIGEMGISIMTGQIMSRIAAKADIGEEVVDQRRVIIPKAINEDGSISVEAMPVEDLKIVPDENKMTKNGDIVIKLSTPYDAAMIDVDTEGCVVPSFCAIVRNNGSVSNNYLLAFLNSKVCKKQLTDQVAGQAMTILSVGKIKNVVIPVPSIEKQREIGEAFLKSRNKINMIKRIMELEAKRNDALIEEIIKEAK